MDWNKGNTYSFKTGNYPNQADYSKCTLVKKIEKEKVLQAFGNF
jgi:hypothetical protein